MYRKEKQKILNAISYKTMRELTNQKWGEMDEQAKFQALQAALVDDLGISGGLIGGLVSKYMPKVLDWVSNKINNWFGGQSSNTGVNPVVYMNA